MFAKSVILIPLCAVLGCESASPIKIVSPRVIGRVVDAGNHEPIGNVKVQRQTARNNKRPMDVPKGGELMKQPPVVKTDAEGHFTLASERDLTVFRSASWFTVRLSFDHPHYQRLVATYPGRQATNSASAEPLIETGDISLAPKAK
jgi:hypothetical protein